MDSMIRKLFVVAMMSVTLSLGCGASVEIGAEDTFDCLDDVDCLDIGGVCDDVDLVCVDASGVVFTYGDICDEYPDYEDCGDFLAVDDDVVDDDCDPTVEDCGDDVVDDDASDEGTCDD